MPSTHACQTSTSHLIFKHVNRAFGLSCVSLLALVAALSKSRLFPTNQRNFAASSFEAVTSLCTGGVKTYLPSCCDHIKTSSEMSNGQRKIFYDSSNTIKQNPAPTSHEEQERNSGGTFREYLKKKQVAIHSGSGISLFI